MTSNDSEQKTIELSLEAANADAIGAIVEPVVGWVTADEALALYRAAAAVRSGCVVEIGACEGRSTVALSLGAAAGADAPVFTIEPHETFVGANGGKFGPHNRLGFMRNMIETGCYRNVRLVNLSSEVVTAGWDREVGMLWIDGDHRYDAVRRDWECWRRHLAPGATVAFDDSTDPRLGPKQLIEELVAAGDLSDVRLVGKVTFAHFRE